MQTVLGMLVVLTLAGCTSTVPVTRMEGAIEQALLAAQRGGQCNQAGNGFDCVVDKVTIELSVTVGYKGTAGATAPIPVVPITLGGEISKTNMNKVVFTADPANYRPLDADDDFKLKGYTEGQESVKEARRRYLLNTKTGELIEVPQ
jgi:hypothetical protein